MRVALRVSQGGFVHTYITQQHADSRQQLFLNFKMHFEIPGVQAGALAPGDVNGRVNTANTCVVVLGASYAFVMLTRIAPVPQQLPIPPLCARTCDASAGGVSPRQSLSICFIVLLILSVFLSVC